MHGLQKEMKPGETPRESAEYDYLKEISLYLNYTVGFFCLSVTYLRGGIGSRALLRWRTGFHPRTCPICQKRVRSQFPPNIDKGMCEKRPWQFIFSFEGE
jgi:hypothetical protein